MLLCATELRERNWKKRASRWEEVCEDLCVWKGEGRWGWLAEPDMQTAFYISNTTSRSAQVGTAKAGMCVDSTAQPISPLSLSIISFPPFYQLCFPQSSAVIKQPKGSVNWDDGIGKRRWIYVRACMTVNIFSGKGKKKTWLGRQRQMRLDGRECICLHLETVSSALRPHLIAPLHWSCPSVGKGFQAQVLCQGEVQ